MNLPEYVPPLHPGPRAEEAYSHYRKVRGQPWKVTERAFIDVLQEVDPWIRSLAALEVQAIREGEGSFPRVVTLGEEDILQELRGLLIRVLRNRRTREMRTVTSVTAAVYEGYMVYRRREVREARLSLLQGLVVSNP